MPEADSKRVMVITGASAGLGRGLAEHFYNKGWIVCALARHEDKLRELREHRPHGMFTHVLDVSDAAQVKQVFGDIEREQGRIDVLINNAGVVPHDNKIGADDFTCIDPTIDINLKGTMYCTYAVIPGMIKRGDGRIINIASRAGVVGGMARPRPGEPLDSFCDYSASKFGVVGFANSIARQLLPQGVQMTTLCPGGIAGTAISQTWPVAQSSLIQPPQIASLIDFIISQEKNIYFKEMLFFASFEWH